MSPCPHPAHPLSTWFRNLDLFLIARLLLDLMQEELAQHVEGLVALVALERLAFHFSGFFLVAVVKVDVPERQK